MAAKGNISGKEIVICQCEQGAAKPLSPLLIAEQYC